MSESNATPSANAKSQFQHDAEDQDDQIDLLAYWRTVRKYKWAILAFALVITLLAGVIAFVSTPIFEAKTTLLIETNKQTVVSIEEVYGGVRTSNDYFQTQVEIIKSREVALKAVNKLKLYDHPDYDPRGPKKGVAALIEKLGFSTQDNVPNVWTEESLAQAVLPAFMGDLSIEPIRNSQLVVVRFTSPSAAFAAKVANTLANTYIENDLDARYKMTRTASAWLEGQLAGLKDKLTQSESALQGFREQQGIVNIEEAAQSGVGQQIALLQSRLIEARTRRAEVEATNKIIQDAASKGDLASQPTLLNNAQVTNAKSQANQAARKFAEVTQRYGREHPRYMEADSDVKSAADNLQRQIEAVVASVTQELARASSTEKTLERALSNARGNVVNINRKEFELGVYEREVAANRQMYDMFMQRTKETAIASNLQSVVARVVDAAVVPTGPIKPKKRMIVAIALLLGLLAGVMLALLREMLDNTLKASDDVEARLKLPLLTVLPMLAKKETERSVSSRFVLDSPNSLYSEAIRTARTGVLLSSIDLPSRTLVVTSSVPGEGKTTFSSNLAMAHAQTKKTLLIDADMRRPSIAKNYGLEPWTVGLSELVSGNATLQESLHKVADSNLMVMPSGVIPPNPLELLHSERFAKTLLVLAKHFEIIIIDSPPVELVSDAMVIAALASGVIFVTKAHSTPLPLARKALQRLRAGNVHIVGVVLNALDFKKAEQYYGEYSGYGKHGYGTYGSTYGGTYGAGNQSLASKKAV
jgi:succinoglycan biosynthesis transport protein ExoP